MSNVKLPETRET